MTLPLFGHPFSSYSRKVLVALYENGKGFTLCKLGPEDPDAVAEWERRWPLKRFPLLVDGERSMADCAAAPALLFAHRVQPAGDARPRLNRNRARLEARPSVARTIEASRPYRRFFPFPIPA